jgi:8-oxo-dGTP diphosphatase
VITVGYFSLIKPENFRLAASSFARKAEWINMGNVPELAFDHDEILSAAFQALKTKLRNHPVAFELLPKKFTIGQLQNLYESILGVTLDKRNFRRKVSKLKFIEPLDEQQTGVAHKPAMLYQFNHARYEKLNTGAFDFQ